MKSLQKLVELYLDDREAMSSKDMARLARELERSPALAATVKDQLILRELVSQRLAEDRRNFPAQAGQRRRDDDRGEDELFRQVMEIRALAAEELRARGRSTSTFSRLTFWTCLAAALFMAVTAGVYWTQGLPAPTIAQIAAIEGEVLIERGPQRLSAVVGSEIKTGDRLHVAQDATATVRYPDQTTVLLDSEAVVQFDGRPAQAKQLLLAHGGLSADVAPQPPEAPLVVETDTALVRVMGTRFFAYAEEAGTRVGVTEGYVILVRRRDGEEATVAAGNSGFASPQVLETWHGVWPSNLAGAALVFEDAFKANAGIGATGTPQPVTLIPQGRARLSEHGALVLDDGAYLALGAGEAIYDACQRTSQLTVEAIVQPNDGRQEHATILSFDGGVGEAPNFSLTQSLDRIVFVLKTAGGEQSIEAASVPHEGPRRLAITYRPGRLAWYVDGELRFERKDLPFDLRNWTPGELIFGDEPEGGHNWRGVLEGVAIYNRVLCRNEIQRNATAYEAILNLRRPVSASDLPAP